MVINYIYYLRDAETGNGETSNEIAFEHVKFVASSPFKNREHCLNSELHLLQFRLVLERPERVVVEEGLLEGIPELINPPLLWWLLHLVRLSLAAMPPRRHRAPNVCTLVISYAVPTHLDRSPTRPYHFISFINQIYYICRLHEIKLPSYRAN